MSRKSYQKSAVITSEKGLCRSIGSVISENEFFHMSGANYQVNRVQAVNPKTNLLIPNQYHLMRNSDNVVVGPKTVTASYAPISPVNLLNSVSHIVDGGYIMPTDFILHNRDGIVGQTETLAFRICDDVKSLSNGENWEYYFLLNNSHGKGKVTGNLAAYRLHCKNQLLNLLANVSWGVSHSAPRGDNDIVRRRIEHQIKLWGTLQTLVRETNERMNKLLAIPLNWEKAIPIVHSVLGISDPEEISTQKENKILAIQSEFKNPNRGTEGLTAYDFYQAWNSVDNHGSSFINSKALPEDRTSGMLLGSDGELEANLLEELLALA